MTHLGGFKFTYDDPPSFLICALQIGVACQEERASPRSSGVLDLTSTMLLLWAPSITPHSPSNLAAIRFGAQVCVEYIRIVPNGTRAFLKEPLSIGYVRPFCGPSSHNLIILAHSHSKPSVFSLDIMFNQQGGAVADGGPKIPVNALSPPRRLAYKGEMLDYMIEMDSQVCWVRHSRE